MRRTLKPCTEKVVASKTLLFFVQHGAHCCMLLGLRGTTRDAQEVKRGLAKRIDLLAQLQRASNENEGTRTPA